ncbi:hypothetical protein TNCV_3658491 [Trichonephila clavipes]|nr:hypothetical protein TNCV_3658491 [Trichonephila clavipes]
MQVTEASVLKLPDFESQFELYTDAIAVGVGAVMKQQQRPIEFASRTLSSAKRNYTVTERGCDRTDKPGKSIAESKISCAVIRSLVLRSREQIIEEKRKDPGLRHINRYLENPEDSSVKAEKLVMVTNGVGIVCRNIEKLFEEARQSTKIQQDRWAKYCYRRRREVNGKVKVQVLVQGHPMSSASKKLVPKFKPKFEGPYKVRISGTLSEETVVRMMWRQTGLMMKGLETALGEGRSGQREDRMVKRLLQERENFLKRASQRHWKRADKRRPHESHQWKKRPALQSLQSGPRTMRRPNRSSNQESWRSRVETSKAESRKKPEALPGMTSSCPLRSRAEATDRQDLVGRISIHSIRSRAETRRQGEEVATTNRGTYLDPERCA